MKWKSIVPLVVCIPLVSTAQKKVQEQPNIIVFLVDDMGWQDTSLPFWTERTPWNNLYETPNMERLADQGMMFTQAYACSVSSPSRVSLMTGMNAARHHVTNWTLEKNKSNDGKSDIIQPPSWNINGICQTEGIDYTYQVTSLAQILKDNGYHTIHCGKAHFGAKDTPGESPYHFGFEANIAGHAGGGLASYLGTENFGNKTDGQKSPLQAIPGLDKYWGQDIFVTEALTLEAKKALDHAQKLDQPFFLYMAHYAIHIPIQKDMRFYQKYRDKGMTEIESAYASLIEGMDKSLGDLMDYLEINGIADNTIIMFMSDNGGLAATSRSGEPHTQNSPLNSGKGSAYEGGIREPMIVSWPQKVKKQSKNNEYIIIEDFFPTILEMAGVDKYRSVQPVDGVSFVPLLIEKGNPSENRKLYWNFPNIWGPSGPGIGATCSVRDGDWKLIYYYDIGKKELFNVAEDIGEINNLSEKRVDIVRNLSKDLGKYLREVNAQRPSFKDTGKLVPWPDEV